MPRTAQLPAFVLLNHFGNICLPNWTSPSTLGEMNMFMRISGMLLGVGLATSAASAQNPFMGAWKLDPLKTRMPDEMKVQSTGANTYTFDFGGGPETIVADGSDQ